MIIPLQETFDTVVIGLRKQGRPAVDKEMSKVLDASCGQVTTGGPYPDPGRGRE